jgi:hypothetical protein
MGAERAGHDRVISTAKAIGATDVISLLNDSPAAQPRFGFRPNRAMAVELGQKVRDAGMTWHLGSWIDPKPQYVAEAAVELASLAEESRAASVCLDAEGEWRVRIDNHLEFVAQVVHPAFDGFPVPIGVTSLGALPKEVAPLLAWAVEHHDGYGQPQAYSVWQGKKWQQLADVQPDRITALAWRTWSPLTKKLVVLLAAFGDVHPGHSFSAGQWQGGAWTVADALETNLLRAEYDGFTEFGSWSEEALRQDTKTAKIRREVLAEVKVTGKSTAVDTGSVVAPVLAGTAFAGAAFLTRKWWLPKLGLAFKFIRGR